MASVVITSSSFDARESGLRRRLEDQGLAVRHPWRGRVATPEELAQEVMEARYILAGAWPLTPELLDHAPDLTLIARLGVGLDNIDLPYCKRRGIRVTYTPAVIAYAVAELTVGFVLDLCRGITFRHESMRAQKWQRTLGLELREATVGLLGFGRIGMRVAELLRPFGPRILAHSFEPNRARERLVGAKARMERVEVVSREELLSRSDVVSVHVPLTTTTRGILNEAAFAAMRPGAMIINTSRGGIVDEAALVRALDKRHLSAAALDVYAQEPYQGPLCQHPRVLLSCHVGTATYTTQGAMETQATEEVLRCATGQPPIEPVYL